MNDEKLRDGTIIQTERLGVSAEAAFPDSKTKQRLWKSDNIVAASTGKSKNGERTEDVIETFYVKKKIPIDKVAENELIPKTIAGKRTDVVEVGEIVAEIDLDSKQRPAFPGCSIKNYAGSGKGTHGTIFRNEPFDGRLFGGSNTHVYFADPCKPISEQASKEIMQPAAGASADARLGLLCTGTMINDGGMNTRDSAMHEFHRTEDAFPGFKESGLPLPERVRVAEENEEVVLYSWKMNGISRGHLTRKGVTVKVGGYGSRPVTFPNVDLFERMSTGGVSGSDMRSDNGKSYSHLLFAGSPTISVGIPFHQAWDVYDKVPVLKDWWDEFKDNGNGGGNGNGNGPNPPSPPEAWTFRGIGLFLLGMGAYLLAKIGEGPIQMDSALLAFGLLAFGLVILAASFYYGIQKK